MRFTHAQPDLDACRRHVTVHEQQRQRVGCAPWTIIEKAGGKIIGWGGLYDDPFEPGWGIEVAYLFAPSAWGRGYATELVTRCVEIAGDELRIPRLIAFAHPGNAASRRVLHKSGFLIEHFVPEMRRLLYACATVPRASVI